MDAQREHENLEGNKARTALSINRLRGIDTSSVRHEVCLPVS